MSNMSYLAVLERYRDQHRAIDQLLSSIVTGLTDYKLLNDEDSLKQAMRWLSNTYPFVDLIFTLDPSGTQISDNVSSHDKSTKGNSGRGRNRSQRPYFLIARDSDMVAITEPYLSSASHLLCISAAEKVFNNEGELAGYLVVDIDLAEAVEFLMGDRARRRYQPFFKSVYSLIVVGLFSVVLILLYTASVETIGLFSQSAEADVALKPFSIIIYLTLALAVFDLGKTMLEEEVLMHKDIFRHSSTRRTITRFIAAILIAVSIESLLLMFKSVLGDGTYLVQSVLMMLAAVGLLVGLGTYVFLGAKAEQVLLQATGDRRRSERRKI